jgi:hypothetical protein
MREMTRLGAIAVLAIAVFGCSEDFGAPSSEGDGLTRSVAVPGPSDLLFATEEAKIGAPDPWHGDGFGNAVAASGERLVVGSSNDDVDNHGGNCGSAFVFVRSGDGWVPEFKLVPPDSLSDDGFGGAVAISGDTLVVGASGHDTAATDGGAAYVFRRSGTVWLEQQKLVPADGGSTNERFGETLALDAGVLAVGARGAVRIFRLQGSLWVETQKIVSPSGTSTDTFGRVALSGETLVVGSPHETIGSKVEQGAAYVFDGSGAAFAFRQLLFDPDGTGSDHFGTAVAVSGDTILIGTDRAALGAAYVFARRSIAFDLQAKLEATTDATNGDRFGTSVAIEGDIALIGAPFHEHGGQNGDHGSAYLFRRVRAVWTELEELFPSDAQNNDHFGSALAVKPGIALIGSPNDDVPFVANGSAYVFRFEYVAGPPDGDACILVAPDGDNASALASNGASPFRDVQAAVDFADSHRHIGTSVCVAAGPVCGVTAEYTEFPDGRLTMRSGISVLGKHESTTWTRCSDSVTRLSPPGPVFVDFGPGIAERTVFDGFEITGSFPSTPAVAIRGARGVELADIVVPERNDPPEIPRNQYAMGIDVEVASEVTLTRCDIFAPPSHEYATALRVTVANITIQDSTLRAVAGCATGMDARDPESLVAVGNVVRVAGTSGGGCPEEHAGIRAKASVASEITLEGNDIEIVGGFQSTSGILTSLAVATGNRVSALSQDFVAGINASGSSIVGNDIDVRTTNGLGFAYGILCEDCLEVSGNTAVAFVENSPPCITNMACTSESTGALVGGAGTLVEGNHFQGGCGKFARGLTVAGPVRVQNNFLSGGACPSPHRLVKSTGVSLLDHFSYPGSPDIHSNLLDGGGEGSCTSAGLELLAHTHRAAVRNNLILPGSCQVSFSVDQTSPISYAERFQNNDLAPGGAGSAFYRIQGLPDPTTIDAVNALGPHSSGNFSASCELPLEPSSVCVDAGIQEGAPSHDFEGHARDDGFPDVGPDEL